MRAIRSALLLVCSASSLVAQGWTGGFKGGLGQGGFTGKSAFTWSASGLNIVGFAARPVTDGLFAQVEVAMHQKVGVSRVGGSLLTFTGDYITLPLLLRKNFGTRIFTPFMLAGPSLTLQIHCDLQMVTARLVSNID